MKALAVASAVLWLAASAAGAQTITLSGSPPAALTFVPGTTLMIAGSFTINYSGSGAQDTTTDVAPRSAQNDRETWTNLSTLQTFVFESAEIYRTQTQAGEFIIKMWGTDRPITSDNVIEHRFASGPSSATYSYYLFLSDARTPPAGTYRLPITVRTRAQAFGRTAGTIAASLDLALSVTVDQVAHLSITDAKGSYNPSDSSESFDFGDLAAAKAVQFKVFVSSNFRYALTVSSQHGGVMAHLDPAVADSVPYTLAAAGATVPLGAGTQTIADNQPANSTGTPASYSGTITPGSSAGKAAGNYTDSLTLTIIAR